MHEARTKWKQKVGEYTFTKMSIIIEYPQFTYNKKITILYNLIKINDKETN